jgi:hypothetical protein
MSSAAGPDFSIHCTPSSRVTQNTRAADFPMRIGDSVDRSCTTPLCRLRSKTAIGNESRRSDPQSWSDSSSDGADNSGFRDQQTRNVGQSRTDKRRHSAYNSASCRSTIRTSHRCSSPRAIRRPAARTSNTSPRFLAIELDVRGKPTPWLDGRNDCDAPRADWRRSRHSPRMLLVQSKDLRTRAVPFARRARRHQDSMGEKGSSLCEDSCSYLPTNNERTAGHWAI